MAYRIPVRERLGWIGEEGSGMAPFVIGAFASEVAAGRFDRLRYLFSNRGDRFTECSKGCEVGQWLEPRGRPKRRARRRVALWTVVIAVMPLLACSTSAQEGESPKPPKASRLEKLFRGLDINGNGVISRDEVRVGRLVIFIRMDRNDDGILTRQEYLGLAGSRWVLPERAVLMNLRDRSKSPFDRADGNADGVIDRDEWKAAGDRRFQAIDTDGSGFFSLTEFVARGP